MATHSVEKQVDGNGSTHSVEKLVDGNGSSYLHRNAARDYELGRISAKNNGKIMK